LKAQRQTDFGKEGLETWQAILDAHGKVRREQVAEPFHQGLEFFGISSQSIPDLDKVNEKLRKKSGFQGLFVNGLEGVENFYTLLAQKLFPIGHFIRDKKDLSYTPEPDIVHDLYGHMPFLIDEAYSRFCQKFGEITCQFLDRPDLVRQFERFFWFTIEFGLIKTPEGVRVFGAGIASSTAECAYALSEEPKVVPFDVDKIRQQEFRIDEIQKKLFLLESPEQLYESLDELYLKVRGDR